MAGHGRGIRELSRDSDARPRDPKKYLGGKNSVGDIRGERDFFLYHKRRGLGLFTLVRERRGWTPAISYGGIAVLEKFARRRYSLLDSILWHIRACRAQILYKICKAKLC